jgi:DNA invertase Pin-like site-specific DNA recombinase
MSRKPNAPSRPRAVAYIRVSTEEQATEGVSLAAQEAAVRAYCAMRGMDVAEVVIDAGVSAGKPLASREGGARVLSAVKRGEVSSVVAYKLDRLFRDCADCLTVTREWDRCEVALHLIDLGGQAIDTSTAMGRFFLTVMAGAAEMERNLIRERTSSAMAHMKSQGERVGAVPYGYRLGADGVHLEAEDSEQRMIGLVRAYRAEGLSIRAIAERLNLEAAPARGGRWHPTSVARLLAKEAA